MEHIHPTAMKVKDILTEYIPPKVQQRPNEEQDYIDWCAEYDRVNPIVDRIGAEEFIAEIRALRGE